jgi:LCP family protein required for cell wall assembly
MAGHSHRPRRNRVIGWVSVVLVVVLAGGAMAAYVEYRSVWTSISRVPVPVQALGKRPPVYNSALNILVYGSDSRVGLTRRQELRLHVGRSQGENNTDSVMVVHIPPGRRGVTVLNIPRDTQVPYYACPPRHVAGQEWPGQHADQGALERINAVLAAGGPACLWKTVEQQTGIRIDHFIALGLAGFVNVIDDLGGVRVCLPFRVHVPMSGLRLRAGKHHIGGVQALAFWRTREGIGTGSDLERIQRDQYLLARVLHGILRSGLLSSPSKMLAVVSDAARSMTTDTALTSSDMLQIAESLRGLSSQDVQFVTAPSAPYPPDPAEVEFRQPRAGALFSAIAHDSRLPSAASGILAAKTPVRPSARSSGRPVGKLAISDGGITGSASCTSDSGAFAGPLSPRG